MNSKIIILSSDKTGHGHESIVQALKEQFSGNYPQTDLRIINGFNIGGPFGRLVEQLYFPMVKHAPFLWKPFFQFTSHFPFAVDYITATCIKKSFIKAVREFHPDIIVTVHPAFVGSVNKLLEKYYMNIPVLVLIADLVTISGLWADSRSSCILSPTEEAKSALLEFGIDENKIKVYGFPVRKRFGNPDTGNKITKPEKPGKSSLNLLVFANAFSKIKTVSIVENLLNSFDCTVTLLTGRDERLKKYIGRRLLDKAGNRLVLPGYVVNMEEYMQTSDILITKAGPNILMEAVHSMIPVIITGNLPGQEEGTTEWILSQGMGASGYDADSLIETIRDMIDNDRALLKEIASNQRNYENRNAAREIVKFISGYAEKNDAYSEVPCIEELGAM